MYHSTDTSQSTLILLRHGSSEWTEQNRFCGWEDVDLTTQGVAEATRAGTVIADNPHTRVFQVCYTSILKRAIKTLELVLRETRKYVEAEEGEGGGDIAGRVGAGGGGRGGGGVRVREGEERVSVVKTWKLNERMYGALTGLNKNQCADIFGEAQVKIWRRSYSIPPPPLLQSDPRHPCNNNPHLYKNLTTIPATESLKDVTSRVIPFYKKHIETDLKQGKTVLVVTHGSVIRSIYKYLENLSESEIEEIDIPTGIPLVYHFSVEFNHLRPVKHYFMASDEEVKRGQERIKNQGKKTTPSKV